MNKIIATLVFFASLMVYAHSEKKHSNKQKIPEEILEKINIDYLANVKPIFKIKCLDCHGTGNPLPWYTNIPGLKQLIQHDIQEAKEHIDMTNGFPFGGHGSPKDDLEELNKILKENTMPPLQYKLIHWSSSLSEGEKKAVHKWITNSLELLSHSHRHRH